MEKANRIDGYTYHLSQEDVKNIPEFKEFSDDDFVELKPSILVVKSGCRKQKVFIAFMQIGNRSEQLLFLHISNCTFVSTPAGEFHLPYEESFDGIAKYTLELVSSGQFDWRNLINDYKKDRVEIENFLRRPI